MKRDQQAVAVDVDPEDLEGQVQGTLVERAARGQRWQFLDALRGFDMFWIAGGGLVISTLNRVSENGLTHFLKRQLTHVEWDGFRFYDLIFPLFVFLAGVSLVLSLNKAVAREGKGGAFRRLAWRALLLFVVGIIYSGGVSRGWAEVRVLGVLQRIAVGYLGAAMIYLWVPRRGLKWVLAGILGGYFALLEVAPVRDIRMQDGALKELAVERGTTDPRALWEGTTGWVRGVYEPGYNVVNHFDFRFLPGRLYDKYWDPEGILSMIPAVGTCLLGVLASLLLLREDVRAGGKSARLVLWGVTLVLGGYFWAVWMPVIKKIWTSSYVLVAGGWSLILLGVFHQMIEVWDWRRWCIPFIWVGTNSITIYFATQLLGFPRIAERLAGGPIRRGLGGAGEVLVSLVAIGLLFAFARFLHRRQVFLRL